MTTVGWTRFLKLLARVPRGASVEVFCQMALDRGALPWGVYLRCSKKCFRPPSPLIDLVKSVYLEGARTQVGAERKAKRFRRWLSDEEAFRRNAQGRLTKVKDE